MDNDEFKEAYLTAKEVAEMVRLSEQTIRRFTVDKEIPYHKISRMVRYKKSEIIKWIDERNAAKAGRKKKKNAELKHD